MSGQTVKVYIVDGQKVRERFKTDFAESGHAYVYPWIPSDEIWLDQILSQEEKELALLHEFTERRLMKHERMGYDLAHEQANKEEWLERSASKGLCEPGQTNKETGCTPKSGKVGPSPFKQIPTDEYAGLNSKDKLDLDVIEGIKPAPSCANGFGDCTNQAFNEYKKNGTDVYHGYAVRKDKLKEAEQHYRKLVGIYGEGEVGPQSTEAIPHAWNVKDGKILDRTLGSKAAKDYIYFGKKIPKDVLDKMSKGDEIAGLDIDQKSLPIQYKTLGPHKFGCLMAILPDSLRKQITDFALENILDAHLTEEGIVFSGEVLGPNQKSLPSSGNPLQLGGLVVVNTSKGACLAIQVKD